MLRSPLEIACDFVDTFERWIQRGGVLCREAGGGTRLSTGHGWWNWFVRVVARTNWPGSSSLRRRRYGAGGPRDGAIPTVECEAAVSGGLQLASCGAAHSLGADDYVRMLADSMLRDELAAVATSPGPAGEVAETAPAPVARNQVDGDCGRRICLSASIGKRVKWHENDNCCRPAASPRSRTPAEIPTPSGTPELRVAHQASRPSGTGPGTEGPCP